jgi:hypothetical protein
MTMDADLKNPPEEIPKFINKMKDGYNVVVGRRVDREDNLFWKIPSYFMNKFISCHRMKILMNTLLLWLLDPFINQDGFTLVPNNYWIG